MLASGSLNPLLSFHSPMTPDYHTTLSVMSSGYKSLYLDRTDLDQEQVRLQTFLLWPKWAPKSITKESMARIGLYFTGDSDIVKCFSCKVVLGRWREGDVPLIRHRQQAPQCTFLVDFDDEDDLVVDGECQRSEGEDCVDGATAEACAQRSTLQHKSEHQTLSSVSNFTNTREMQCNKLDKSQLKHENETLRKAMICRQCKTERIQTLFLPCRHLVTCEKCADIMDDCVECHQRILGTVRTFMV